MSTASGQHFHTFFNCGTNFCKISTSFGFNSISHLFFQRKYIQWKDQFYFRDQMSCSSYFLTSFTSFLVVHALALFKSASICFRCGSQSLTCFVPLTISDRTPDSHTKYPWNVFLNVVAGGLGFAEITCGNQKKEQKKRNWNFSNAIFLVITNFVYHKTEQGRHNEDGKRSHF